MNQLELSEMHSPEIDTAPKAPKYPKSVFFIIATELSERFSYYGMRAVLTIYMRNVLKFSEDTATTLYHTFLLLCYGLPIFWGIIADSFLGKFRTIWMVSLFFAIGNIILTVSSIPPLHLPSIPLAMLGLLFMAIGTGGMKPCVAPFGGEQFILPQQTKYLEQFFSVFFFAVTVGNMISTVITPVFRRDVHCFGLDTCYPLAFGVPAVIMIVAVVVFVSGKSLYKINNPEGNMLVKVVRCIMYALLKKNKNSNSSKKHWLHHSEDKFELNLINEIQMLLRVLVYYLPIPMFFALYEQLGSRWTLQATRMNGKIGSFTIKPDQMQVSNAILMFLFIPVFQGLVYPLFKKCNLLKRPLQRMVIGGFLASSSFLVAGIVEMEIEKTQYIPPPPSQLHVHFINTLQSPVRISDGLDYFYIGPQTDQMSTIDVNATLTLTFEDKMWMGNIPLNGSLQSALIYLENGSLNLYVPGYAEDFKKSNEGNAKIRALVMDDSHVQLRNDGVITLTNETIEIAPEIYKVYVNDEVSSGEIDLHPGGSYLLAINKTVKLVTLVSANEVHMLWLIPQYVLMAWAEILFIVSGMEFSFTQAPKSMKSVLQSLWHLMNAFGNVIVILSAQGGYSQATMFLGFSAAMLIDTILFGLLAMRYKYVECISTSTDKNDNKEEG